MHQRVADITQRIRDRSTESRGAYLAKIERSRAKGPRRAGLSCGNIAHASAACATHEKAALLGGRVANIAIVSSYNDMLSAHQPFERFPALLKQAVREAGGVAQFAGGVPAMCDGVTQGQPGMELSLFSRDVVAMATAVALAHDMFDGALLLGVCDKIVPGLVIGALAFGHLPTILVPAGPMPSGLPNREKSRIRQLYAEGKVGRDGLMEAEAASYHAPGTCTFYGTANSNELLMEMMGLHLPGAAFVHPNTKLRDALTQAAGRRVLEIGWQGNDWRPIGHVVDERAVVNGIVGLLATGGSTNHTMHLVAMAAAAGIRIDWDDFAALSAVVPLLARIYPNGSADINAFQAAGGTGFLIATLLDAGLLHGDVLTVAGGGLADYAAAPTMEDGALAWHPAPAATADAEVLRAAGAPFGPTGGLAVLRGGLGSAVAKVSAVAAQHQVIEAPAAVFDAQDDVLAAFKAGELERDCVVVVRFQGPRANGMPELHKLTPALGVLQDRGFRVALLTDGRMSGASGKVLAAIHVTPEAAGGGPLSRLREGDVVRIDAAAGVLEVMVPAAEWVARVPAEQPVEDDDCGRNLFAVFRRNAAMAEEGAGVFG